MLIEDTNRTYVRFAPIQYTIGTGEVQAEIEDNAVFSKYCRKNAEVAKVNGASELLIYVKIVLPLGKPILVIMGLITDAQFLRNNADFTSGFFLVKSWKPCYNQT